MVPKIMKEYFKIIFLIIFISWAGANQYFAQADPKLKKTNQKVTAKKPQKQDKKEKEKIKKQTLKMSKKKEATTAEKQSVMASEEKTQEKSVMEASEKSPPLPLPAKDEVLEELQLFTQGIDTLKKHSSTSENTKPSQDIESLENSYKEYQKSKNYASQIHILNLLIAKKPTNKQYQFEKILAKKALEYDPFPNQLKKNEISTSLQKLIDIDPQFKKAHWALFDIIHHYNEWTKGTKFSNEEDILLALNLIKDISKKFGENRKTIRWTCHYMVAHFFYTEAKVQCLKLKNTSPNNPEGYIYTDYILSGKKEKALLNILKKFPHSQKVFLHVAQMFFDKKNFELSLKYFKKALKTDPQSFPALFGTAETLFKLNKTKEALVYYLKACKKNKIKAKIPFQKAKAQLSRKSLFQLANEYQNHINFCLN